MKVYDAASIRNVALVGHGGAGKTQLASAMLFDAGMVNRFGKVDDGTTVTDYDEEEVARKHTLTAKSCVCRVEQDQDQSDRYARLRQFSERCARRAARRRCSARRRRCSGRCRSADRKGLGCRGRAQSAAPCRIESHRSRARQPRTTLRRYAMSAADGDSHPASSR